MSNFRFILETYKGRNTRYTCPDCMQPHQFTRYIDTNTGLYLADHVGLCNRRTKCGYHYPPKQYFNDNPLLPSSRGGGQRPEGSVKTEFNVENLPPDYIDHELFNASQNNYDSNNLIKYLDSIFSQDTVNNLIAIYKIGTSSRYKGGTTVFWQIDIDGNIRTGKLIKYDPLTGHRLKKPYVATNWVHAIQYTKDFNLKQCLFGEHLLNEDSSAPIAIVESEKTAIIAQAKMPDYLWMATGCLHDFKPAKLNVLKGRKVVAFPDMGAYDYWLKKTADLDLDITISNYLEKNATEQQIKEGLDIADFL